MSQIVGNFKVSPEAIGIQIWVLTVLPVEHDRGRRIC